MNGNRFFAMLSRCIGLHLLAAGALKANSAAASPDILLPTSGVFAIFLLAGGEIGFGCSLLAGLYPGAS